ncbi:MAG: hypothetical protein CL943_01975 [Candidatus Diapherotrites archaeon]|uniref:Uncharacterized protein n=1 Tax=Candidatus Iainarchaeum sp. TaxID=3101447 RepID=A0A2D6M0V6_9ARCH|nr:hypothetical protein [Candidatus Diapherotrites archaeon]|tara:strand:- start:1854 stop:2657 length:804 start_codon:yes stop_codon:yes gene_type:complete
MWKKILTALVLIILLNFVSAPDPVGWQEGTSFDYYIGIGSGTERPNLPPRYTGREFLFDIDIFTPTSGGDYIDLTDGTIVPSVSAHFESEFHFCIWKNFCLPITGNDVYITKFKANPAFVAPGDDTDIEVTIKNDNGSGCDLVGADLTVEVFFQDGTTEIDCTASGPSVWPIVAGDEEMFTCTTDLTAGWAPLDIVEGRYDMRTALSNSDFGSATGCTDNILIGNNKNGSFVVTRGVSGPAFPIPEINAVAIVIVGLAVLLIIKRKS